MAGYIFSLDNLDSLKLYTRNGVYATKFRSPLGYWAVHHEGTFADYASMKAGDNVYFFIGRRIYGIGKLIDIGGDCKYFNYLGAEQPRVGDYQAIRHQLLWDEGVQSIDQRCVCIFEPDPFFFISGIDMDDVLSSNPASFKMLRAFWKLSFIKFDDEENQAFRDIVLKRNQIQLSSPRVPNQIFPYEPIHDRILDQVLTGDYSIGRGISAILSNCAVGEELRHEMAIEAGLIYQLAVRDPETCEVFGEWDYLSHQVIASPFKPIDYMDKMDLFGYSYIPGFRPTRSRYLVGEVKKESAREEDIDQLLKYVDWVRDEYCHGDYSIIHAFLVARDFPGNIIRHKHNVGLRKYTVGVRPAQSLEWTNLQLVRYTFDSEVAKIKVLIIG